MNKFNFVFFLLISSLTFNACNSGFVGEILDKGTTSKLFTTAQEVNKKVLDSLVKEREKLQETIKEFSVFAKSRLAEIVTNISVIGKQIEKEPQNAGFLNNKSSVLGELSTTIKDRQHAYKQYAEIVDDRIQMLNDYLKDPNFDNYLKEYRGDRIFTYDDLQTINQMLRKQQADQANLEKREKSVKAELESRIASSQTVSQEYKKKQEELRSLSKTSDTAETFGLDAQQKTELFSLQEELLLQQRELANIKVSVTEHKLDQIKMRRSFFKKRFDILLTTIERVKPTIVVREDEVISDRAELERKREQASLKKGRFRREVESLSVEADRKERELKRLSSQNNIELGVKLNEWEVEPSQSVSSYISACVIGDLNSQYLLTERRKEFFDAQISLEQARMVKEKIKVDVKETYRGIISKQFVSQEAITDEKKSYNTPSTDIKATINSFKGEADRAKTLLSTQQRARDNIHVFAEEIQKKRTTIFVKHQNDYNMCLVRLRDAQARVLRQIDTIGRMSGIYRDIIATSQESEKLITSITAELSRAIGLFNRPSYAIKVKDVKDFVPNVKMFFGKLHQSVSQFSFSTLAAKIKGAFPEIKDFLWLLLKMLLLIIGLIFFRVYAQLRLYKLLTRVKEYRGGGTISLIGRSVLDFMIHYYAVISVWILLFALIKFGALPYHNLKILFYLVSIPYLLYLANRFLYRLILFNERHDYSLLSEQFHRRFFLIFSILLYSTVVILLFRQTFILAMLEPYKTGVPDILLAANIIILQVSLIFLLTREQILSTISEATEQWRTIRSYVDKYFHLIRVFLIAIIVLINPYVGYGRLVSHVLSRLLLTLLFVPVLFWVQKLLKKVSSTLFFSSDDDSVKERFPSAKSWYGLFVIISFIVLIGMGLLVGAWIWGWHFSSSDIAELMQAQIFPGEGEAPISMRSFAILAGFIIGGVLLSFIFTKFVLKRIFDLLLVEMGVQHAVVNIMRTFIIITFSVIGLQTVHLGPLTKWLLGAVVAIGWVIKEPIGDLVAYFILLIQRPIKIGDFVQIDEKVSGVVRKITARSIIIRQKNSTTIVVPNSQVLAKAVVNWNYTSGFVALNDIVIKIHYEQDPDRVIEIIRAAVESHPNVLKSPKPIVRLRSFGEYGFEFLIRPFVSSHYTLDMWDIASDVRLAVVRGLRLNGISIAIPVWQTMEDLAKKKNLKPEKPKDESPPQQK